MQFVCADFRHRMQFRRHGVAPITPSWKSVPRNFSTGNVFSRGGSDMVSILEPLRLVHRTHSSTKQHSKVVPSSRVLGIGGQVPICTVLPQTLMLYIRRLKISGLLGPTGNTSKRVTMHIRCVDPKSHFSLQLRLKRFQSADLICNQSADSNAFSLWLNLQPVCRFKRFQSAAESTTSLQTKIQSAAESATSL